MTGPGAAAARRAWRAAADVRRLLRGGEPEARSLRRPRSMPIEEWNRTTAQRHAEYRARHAVPDGEVAIVCVSRRPHRLGDVVANVARQCDVAPHLVLVPNGDDWDLDVVRRELAALPSSEVVLPGSGATLGTSLNAGMDATASRFVAKFDDDDHYGPYHLADLLRAHGVARAGVVGKHTYYATIEGVADHLLRFPGHEFSYTSTLAGGTLVIDRARTRSLRFADLSLGEDRAFLESCHRAGISTYSGDRFNFVQRRGDDNTWRPPDEAFLAGCTAVDGSAAEHVVDR